MAELSESELLGLKDAFELYEKGSENGKVNSLELGKLLKSLGLLENIDMFHPKFIYISRHKSFGQGAK